MQRKCEARARSPFFALNKVRWAGLRRAAPWHNASSLFVTTETFFSVRYFRRQQFLERGRLPLNLNRGNRAFLVAGDERSTGFPAALSLRALPVL